ncbi:MarR family winged helix-turn-helix transcriptional regulator [Methylovirgula sp. 4M-Z18]|uniref:MarR family winged helix-turn-helix transcriptional regulator n=1 Tax=Methylovirgula sp. 4M-Z18 TaxID=2293567 RepID=UPI000E2FB47B|nr:MarR family transcriptional regulator [Methylovirgula sp. 4M-Z18]RFB78158.1 MarR family transcriptional regulator [Methylovirgula sp. 4M-Z18]
MNSDLTSADALRVWFRLLRLQARLTGLVAERLKVIGISVPQCDVLTTLTEQEGISQQHLAERLYVTKGNISGLVDRLAAAGLVERRNIASDRRSYAIYLTEAGRRMAEQGIDVQRQFIAETLGRMSSQQLLDFERLIIGARDFARAAKDTDLEDAQRAAKLSIRAGKAPILSKT